MPATDAATETSDNTSSLNVRLVPNVGLSSRCFVFEVIDRVLQPGVTYKVGRYSDRNTIPERISFKSKVVSRSHAELWVEDGKLHIKDIGSSSGTFLNRVRLSSPGNSSTAHEIKDGDLVQLGVDYQSGDEPMYRAVRIRVEVNRPSQPAYHRAAFQQLRQHWTVDQTTTSDIQECCICLYAIAPFQALFIAPCSHVFHFKCLRPIVLQNYPAFSCPLCRGYSDLEASVAVEVSDVMEALGLEDKKILSSSSSPPAPSPPSIIQEEEEPEEQIDASAIGERTQAIDMQTQSTGRTDGFLSATLVGSPTFEEILSASSGSA
ncbi:hypothetical protein EC973_001373 [Apophysomyces ossiformis]|uniref:SMAD/FHA domain-containing protein n=1 Tax=Apophysomyces ossiformis TaxID=679940 RepID=A0A8H7BU64_9FUNG|nr:hypothetical protein EC973_001373 [Apophysomyces ossiformis]